MKTNQLATTTHGLQKFFFTFGCDHPNGKHYVEIHAATEEEARTEMFRNFGKHWAFCYSEEGFKGQPEEFGYTRLSTLTA